MLPEIVPLSEGLDRMLSIKVLESVILVGKRICGSIRLESRMSMKDIISGSFSHFRRS